MEMSYKVDTAITFGATRPAVVLQTSCRVLTRKSTTVTESPFPGTSRVACEIAQQPALWPTTLSIITQAIPTLNVSRRPVVLTGAGTSAYAASAIADTWPTAVAVPTTDLLLMSKGEVERSVPGLNRGGLLISLARSGDSPESTAVVERISKLLPLVEHAAIVCNAEGRLAHLSGISVVCLDPATNDRSLAMTASFSNLALAGLCLNHSQAIATHLAAICDRVSQSLSSMNILARQIANTGADRVVVLSSSMHALTREASLKVIELTAGKVMAISESFLGVRHGPQSFIRNDTPVICFISSDRHKQRYEVDVIETLRSQQLGKIVLVGDHPEKWHHDWFVHANALDLADDLRTPFEIPFMQLLAYQFGLHAGIDPDNPSPDGVVTRVVKPFQIHRELSNT